MRQLRGMRLFIYGLSSAGAAFFVSVLVLGGVAFHLPTPAAAANGLPATVPATLGGAVPSLCLPALAGIVAWLVALPLVSFLADRSRSPVGGRRLAVIAALLPLPIASLLFFLPFRTADGVAELILLTVYAMAAGTGLALAGPSGHALGYPAQAVPGQWTAVAAVQTACLAAGALAGLAVAPALSALFPSLGPEGSFQTGWLIFAFAAALALSGAFFAAREDAPGRLPPAPPPDRFVPAVVLDELRRALADRARRSLLCAAAAPSFAFWTFALTAYFACRDLMLADSGLTRGTAIAFLALVALLQPGARKLIARWGVRPSLGRGLLAFVVGLLVLAGTGLAPQEAGLRWNCATAVAQTADGAVWIGTRRGVSRFSGGTWSSLDHARGLIDDRVEAVTADGNAVWFATRAGATRFDGRAFSHYTAASGLVDDRVLDVIPRDGAVWFLTPVGISLLKDAAWTVIVPEAPGRSMDPPVLTCFALAPNGDLWVGAESGLYGLTAAGWSYYTTANGLPEGAITALQAAPDNTVCIGTRRGAAFLSPGGEWSSLAREHGLPDNAVVSLAISPGGELYVATDRGVRAGLKGTPRQWARADGLAHDRVEDILFARDGSIWFATQNGASVLTGSKFMTYDHPFPRLWGVIALLLLALPAALLLSLWRVTAAAATVTRFSDAPKSRREAFLFSLPEMISVAALLTAGVFTVWFFTAAGQSVETSWPARVALIAAALAAAAGAWFFRDKNDCLPADAFPPPER